MLLIFNKLSVVKQMESAMNQRKIIEDFNTDAATISDIMKFKDKVQSYVANTAIKTFKTSFTHLRKVNKPPY